MKGGPYRGTKFVKKSMCTFWQKGNCKRSPCVYAHGDEEIGKPAPNIPPGDRQAPLCDHWKLGKCTYGDKCNFSHGDGQGQMREGEEDAAGPGKKTGWGKEQVPDAGGWSGEPWCGWSRMLGGARRQRSASRQGRRPWSDSVDDPPSACRLIPPQGRRSRSASRHGRRPRSDSRGRSRSPAQHAKRGRDRPGKSRERHHHPHQGRGHPHAQGSTRSSRSRRKGEALAREIASSSQVTCL